MSYISILKNRAKNASFEKKKAFYSGIIHFEILAF